MPPEHPDPASSSSTLAALRSWPESCLHPGLQDAIRETQPRLLVKPPRQKVLHKETRPLWTRV